MTAKKKSAKAVKKPAGKSSAGDGRLAAVLAGELIEKLNANWKTRTPLLARASENKYQTAPRIPTGIFNLDWALRGGLPQGRLSLVWGAKGSFKTSLYLRGIASAQKMCANCWIPWNPISGEVVCKCDDFREPVITYVNVEGAWDKQWTSLMGVDSEKVLYSEPSFGEQATDISEALLRSGEVDILVLDSLAFMVPAAEIKAKAEDNQPGLQARLIGKTIRKFNAAINDCGNMYGRRPTVWVTNQTRQKITMFGDPTTQPGGFAPGFMNSVEIKLSAQKYTMNEETGEPKWVDIAYRLEKSKIAISHSEGEFRLVLANTDAKKLGDIQDEPQIIELAERVGVVDKVKNKWVCMKEEYSAKSQIERRLMVDPEFSYIMRNYLFEKLKEDADRVLTPEDHAVAAIAEDQVVDDAP